MEALKENIASYFQLLYEYYDSFEYANFEFTGGNSSLIFLIIGFTLGGIIAACIVIYSSIASAPIVNKLIGAKAKDKSSALTLSELKLDRMIHRSALKTGKALRKTVILAEEEKKDGEEEEEKKKENPILKFLNIEIKEKTDFKTARFYIPENKQAGAQNRYAKKGSGPIFFLPAVLLCLILGIAAFFFLPYILQLADNMLSMLKG